MQLSTKLFFLLIILVAFNANVFASSKLQSHPQVKSVIDELHKKHGIDKAKLRKIFSQVELKPEIIERMNRPAEGLPWHRYRNIFLKQTRIQQGTQFWEENAEALIKAEKKYGVPSEIIVAIIGVETRFGRVTGGFRVMDALTTLVVDYPKRRKFFRKELVEYVALMNREGIDPLKKEGSYAGALGKPQFMPSSYRHYAVDFDGDGTRDLFNSSADAIGSVANYLKRHGWQRDKAIATRVTVSGKHYPRLVKMGLKPKITLGEAHKYGVKGDHELSADEKAALIELEQLDGNEYWLGLKNFYAITRYNHSALYAMAVYQLSQAIRTARSRVAVMD